MSMWMGGGGPWQAYRSLTRDSSVARRRVSRATVTRIMGFARPYRGLIARFLATLVLGSVLVVAQPLLFRRIVDDGIGNGDATLVTQTAFLVLVLALADAAIGLVGRWFSARIGEGLILDLRSAVFSHVQRQPIAFFTRTQTGALISRLNTDVIGAQQAFTSTLAGVVGNVISLAAVLVAMVALSWQITVLSLLLLPVFLLPARWMGRRLQAQTREQMQLNADMSSMMTERFNVSGALLVKLFGRPDEESAGFALKARRVADIGVQIAMSNRYFFTALTLVASVATAIAYGVGGNLVIDGTLTIGTLLALTALLARLYGPLTALSNVRVDVMTALVSFERVFEVLDLPPLVGEDPDPVPLPSGPVSVEFRDVRFAYPDADAVSLASLESVARREGAAGGVEVLAGISFRIEPGQMYALVGPSGAGKSTVAALAARLYDVTSGAVLVGDVDVRRAARASLSEAIGVVTQDAHMFHDTIRANLAYARPGASDTELMAACRDAQIADLVESLPEGLGTVVGERGYRLSGGEKQRLAIARLLLKAPPVVLLDEATAHLDSDSELAVQRALATALAGRTSLVIAHRLSTIRAADRILVVDGGRVVEQGTHRQLLAAGGLYADLCATQFGSGTDEWGDQHDAVAAARI